MAEVKNQKPIGWYLKEADRLITEVADSFFNRKQITRFHWQVLNTVHMKGAAKISTMHPGVQNFVTKDQLKGLFQDLIKRGWVVDVSAQNELEVQFTELGKSEFIEVVALQQLFFKQLMGGISDADYQTALKVLTRMIGNLSE